MKILWLYASEPHFDYNHWYHLDFARIINQQKDTQLLIYGYNLEKTQWSDLILRPFDTKLTAKDLKKDFNFDIIILDNKHRFVRNPSRWNYANFFKDINNIPIILMEGDFHNHLNTYLNLPHRVDLILQRHYSNLIRGKKLLPQIKQLWFPCSVDINIFKPNPLIKRENLIGSAIGTAEQSYPCRDLAKTILNSEKLVKLYSDYLRNEEYIKYLQSYISHISCSGREHIDAAKMFEIMASGSVLLTDEGNDYSLEKLFFTNSYCTYKRDGSDIIKKAKLIINKPLYRDYVTNRAIKCITKNHTHEIRAKELINIIKNG